VLSLLMFRRILRFVIGIVLSSFIVQSHGAVSVFQFRPLSSSRY
jgi:hypothetical protein